MCELLGRQRRLLAVGHGNLRQCVRQGAQMLELTVAKQHNDLSVAFFIIETQDSGRE